VWPVDDLANRPLADVLDAVAAPTPAPGGGSSSALTCALGAALVEMAAGIGGASDAVERAGAIRARALALAEEELGSYAPVLEARRLPRDDPSRETAIKEALEVASRSPLAVAEAAAEVASLGRDVAAGANPAVRGDAVAGVLLAEAAAVAAAQLVEVNLAAQPDSPALAAARRARDVAEGVRRESLVLRH
jgi:formiminotetrahydrofolate cyclodeaminase